MLGELDFEDSLRQRVATLQGLPATVLAEVGSRVTVTAGVPEMIATVHDAGGRVGTVSGGFHEVLDPLAERLGLDRWRANRLGIDGGCLTGRVAGPVVDAAAKALTLREWAADFGMPLTRTVAVGDGANDLPMMAASGLSVGFDAKPPVRGAADVLLDVRNLTHLLPLLGLRG